MLHYYLERSIERSLGTKKLTFPVAEKRFNYEEIGDYNVSINREDFGQGKKAQTPENIRYGSEEYQEP